MPTFLPDPPPHDGTDTGGAIQGARLRAAREANNLTLEEIGRALRIKPAYLAALEANDLAALPSPAHGRGFRRSYVRYLGLEGDDRAAAAIQVADPASAPRLSLPGFALNQQPPLPPIVRWLIGGAVAIALGYALLQLRHPAPVPIAPPPVALLTPAAAPTVTVTDAPPAGAMLPAAPAPAPVPDATLRVETSAPVLNAAPETSADKLGKPAEKPASPAAQKITVRAVASAWVRVSDANGATLFERVLQPGESWAVPARSGLRLSTGNAGGIVLVKNGEAGAPLGSTAQVLRSFPLTAGQ